MAHEAKICCPKCKHPFIMRIKFKDDAIPTDDKVERLFANADRLFDRMIARFDRMVGRG